MYKLNVLVSGTGSTLDNLAMHCYDEREGMLRGFVEIKRVVADRECEGRRVAQKWNLPFHVMRLKDYADRTSWSESLLDIDVDLHVMGGFLSRICVPERWEESIVNIHPSLLPAYGGKGMYGSKVHEAVVANHEEFTGCSVHTVTNEVDEGTIIGQIKMAVLPWDTPQSLQHSVQDMERKLYPRTILNYLQKRKLRVAK
jgi:phosphoribosylglycinamide formyltransferase-1